MNINRNNYEIWAIDYLEGKLSTSESAEFMLFLAENKDLSDELDTVRDFTISPEQEESKNDFSNLKKGFKDTSLCPENFEEFCIAYYENDLDTEQVEELMAFVQTSSKNKYIFETYGKTIAHADLSIIYKDKRALKKTPRIPIAAKQKKLYASLAIAASLLLLITFSLLLRNNATPQKMISSNDNTEREIVPQKIFSEPEVTSKVDEEALSSTELISVASPSLTKPNLTIKAKATDVVDTNEVPEVFIPSSQLELSAIPTSVKENYIVLNRSINSLHESNSKASKRILESAELSSYNTIESIKHLNLDLILRKSVDGINQVAETELQYNSETDDEGRLLAFALSAERFNIRKKFRN